MPTNIRNRPREVKNMIERAIDAGKLLRLAKTVDRLPEQERRALFAGSDMVKRLLRDAYPDIDDMDVYVETLRRLK